jgi:hypothetical protein
MKHAIEAKTEGRINVTERQGSRHKQLLDDLQERRGYGEFKEEVLDHTVWRTRFERGCRPLIRLQNE